MPSDLDPSFVAGFEQAYRLAQDGLRRSRFRRQLANECGSDLPEDALQIAALEHFRDARAGRVADNVLEGSRFDVPQARTNLLGRADARLIDMRRRLCREPLVPDECEGGRQHGNLDGGRETVEIAVLGRIMCDEILDAARAASVFGAEVLFLYGEGLAHEEIADVLGISEGNSRIVLHRVRASLRSLFDGDSRAA